MACPQKGVEFCRSGSTFLWVGPSKKTSSSIWLKWAQNRQTLVCNWKHRQTPCSSGIKMILCPFRLHSEHSVGQILSVSQEKATIAQTTPFQSLWTTSSKVALSSFWKGQGGDVQWNSNTASGSTIVVVIRSFRLQQSTPISLSSGIFRPSTYPCVRNVWTVRKYLYDYPSVFMYYNL